MNQYGRNEQTSPVTADVLQVNGVAQLHSDILKADLFANYVSIWPTKFQNKTNGITPRRWLRFCNPELSNIITKWLRTDEWVTNLDLLVNLRKVSTTLNYVRDSSTSLFDSEFLNLVNSLLTMRTSNLSGLLRKWQRNNA